MNEQSIDESEFVIPPMPEPVYIWLVQTTSGEWIGSTHDPAKGCWTKYTGPHKIIPGMMSLEELWIKHQIKLIPCNDALWRVCVGPEFFPKVFTFPEVQWAATHIAKFTENKS